MPKPRRPTKPTAASKERRLQGKSERGGVKRLRGRPRGGRLGGLRFGVEAAPRMAASMLHAPGAGEDQIEEDEAEEDRRLAAD